MTSIHSAAAPTPVSSITAAITNRALMTQSKTLISSLLSYKPMMALCLVAR
jgi:hypothetical protein